MSTDSQKISRFARSISTAGFFAIGATFGALGPLLVLWNLFLDSEPSRIAKYLLGFGLGYGFSSLRVMSSLRRARLLFAALILIGGWIALTEWRTLPLFALGVGCAALSQFLLQHGASARPETMLRAGSVAGAIVVCLAYLCDIPQRAPLLLAAFPLILLCQAAFRKRSRAEDIADPPQHSEHRALAGFILGSLVFLQSGCEWGLALWLPIYFIRALGVSPSEAIAMQALFLALLLGTRLLAERLLSGHEQRRLILGAFAIATAGCLALSGTASRWGALLAVVLIASGFAPVYTTTRGILDDRFGDDPALYSGLSLSAAGGIVLLACCLGYIDAWFGLRAIPFLPIAASALCALLQLLLMFEKRLMGSTVEEPIQ